MTNTVILMNPSQIHNAMQWAVENFGHNQFLFEPMFPAAKFKFIFNKSEHATLFALKWV